GSSAVLQSSTVNDQQPSTRSESAATVQVAARTSPSNAVAFELVGIKAIAVFERDEVKRQSVVRNLAAVPEFSNLLPESESSGEALIAWLASSSSRQHQFEGLDMDGQSDAAQAGAEP